MSSLIEVIICLSLCGCPLCLFCSYTTLFIFMLVIKINFHIFTLCILFLSSSTGPFKTKHSTNPLLFLLLLVRASSVPTLVHFYVQHYIILDVMFTSITSVLDACVALNINLNYCSTINECWDPKQENRFRIDKITKCHAKSQYMRMLE